MPVASPIEGGLALVLMRGAADAALLSLFGALLLGVWLAPPVLALIGGKAPAVARRLDEVVHLGRRRRLDARLATARQRARLE